MRWRILRTVYLKELREALRDRRTLFIMVGLPILLYPLALIGMSKLQESQEAAQSARVSKVAVWGTLPEGLEERVCGKPEKFECQRWQGAPAAIRAGLEQGKFPAPSRLPPDLDDIEPEKRPKPNLEDPVVKSAQQAILNRETDAVVILWTGFSSQVRGEGAAASTVLFDSVRPESVKARDRLSDQLRLYREDLRAKREQARGLPEGFARGVDIQAVNVAPAKRRSGMLIGVLLPYLLIAFSVMGAFYATIDMTAGEKERGTMQTLLCAPLEPLEIIGGKFMAAWSLTMISTLINIFSLAATFSRVKMIPGVEITGSSGSYVVALFLLLPITAMATALFLAIGAFAKDFKEGQSYLTPALMGLIMPLMLTMAPGMELNRYLAFVPVVNIALLIKQLFLAEWSADLLFIVLLSSFCYAALALVFATRVFERNNLLLGGKETLGSLLDFRRGVGGRPSPGLAIFLFAGSLVLLFYGSLLFENRGMATVLLVTEYGFLLLPAIVLAGVQRFDWRETFSLRMPSWRAIGAAVLIGISGWTVGAGLLIRLLPPPESLVKALEKILMIEDRTTPLWAAWLLVAVTPALCEELLFRGFIQSGFQRAGKWAAIGGAGFLFALAHASIYRLLPTLFLGVLFGYAVWQTRSVFTGAICHMLNNGLMVTVARSPETARELGISGTRYLPWGIIAAGVAVLLAGILLLPREESAPTT